MQITSTRLTRILRSACASALALLAITGSVQAQTVMVSNLGEEAGGYGAFVNDTIAGDPYVLNVASDFTTGNEAATLDSITLLFDANSSGSGFVLSLYSAGEGQPGSLLETLSGPDSPGEANAYTYSSVNATPLEANTTYWWVGSVGNGQFNYRNTYSSAETGAAGWSIGDSSSFSQLNGGAWESSGGAQVRFSVSVTSAVPEPGTYAAFAGAAALGFAVWRRFTRKQK